MAVKRRYFDVVKLMEEEEGGGKGGLVKIILIVLGVLLLVAITIVGTLFAVGFFDAEKTAGGGSRGGFRGNGSRD